jgi:polysaccharide biosynthesis protein PslA
MATHELLGKDAPVPLAGEDEGRLLRASGGLPNPEQEWAGIEGRLAEMRLKKGRRTKIAFGLVAFDLFAICLGFLLANMTRAEVLFGAGYFRSLGVFTPIYYAIALNLNVHNARVITQPGQSIWRTINASVVAAMSVILVIFLLGVSSYFSRLVFVLGVALSAVLMVLGRWMLSFYGRRQYESSLYANLCIYDDVPITERSGFGAIDARRLDLQPDLNDIDLVTRLGKLAAGMDKVIVHCKRDRREAWSRVLNCLDVDTEIVWPELDSVKPIALRYRGGGVSLQITTGKLKWHQQVIKRAFDLAVTIPAIIVLLPVMLATALAIRIESRGPVLFVQDRIGLGNRPFRMFKFRSMYADQSDAHGSRLTERNDSRVTRVGGFIRATSIDELPQLFNVLKGDMSIVGPRPHPAKALAGSSLYWEVDESYWHRHVIKPGITGLAQVRGHRGNTFSEEHLINRLRADLEYVENWSLRGDVGIILRTFMITMHNNAF